MVNLLPNSTNPKLSGTDLVTWEPAPLSVVVTGDGISQHSVGSWNNTSSRMKQTATSVGLVLVHHVVVVLVLSVKRIKRTAKRVMRKGRKFKRTQKWKSMAYKMTWTMSEFTMVRVKKQHRTKSTERCWSWWSWADMEVRTRGPHLRGNPRTTVVNMNFYF